MQRTVIIDALKRTDFGQEINVRGWVRSRRGNKKCVVYCPKTTARLLKTFRL